MNKILSLALIAFFTLISPSANSQSILLINGKAAEVTLTGDQINSIVQQQIDDYMKAFGHAPTDVFTKAELRTTSKETDGPSSKFHAYQGSSEEDVTFLSSDRPYTEFKKE